MALLIDGISKMRPRLPQSVLHVQMKSSMQIGCLRQISSTIYTLVISGVPSAKVAFAARSSSLAVFLPLSAKLKSMNFSVFSGGTKSIWHSSKN